MNKLFNATETVALSPLLDMNEGLLDGLLERRDLETVDLSGKSEQFRNAVEELRSVKERTGWTMEQVRLRVSIFLQENGKKS